MTCRLFCIFFVLRSLLLCTSLSIWSKGKWAELYKPRRLVNDWSPIGVPTHLSRLFGIIL